MQVSLENPRSSPFQEDFCQLVFEKLERLSCIGKSIAGPPSILFGTGWSDGAEESTRQLKSCKFWINCGRVDHPPFCPASVPFDPYPAAGGCPSHSMTVLFRQSVFLRTEWLLGLVCPRI